MKPSTSTLALGLLLSVAAPCGTVRAMDSGTQILLERANYWRSHQRFDLASEMVNKVLWLEPRQPDALYQAALLAAHRGDNAAAQAYLGRLRQVASADPHGAELVAALGHRGIAGQGDAPAAGTAVAAPSAPARAPQHDVPELVATSADSDDLVPPRAQSGTEPTPSTAGAQVPGPEIAGTRQLASLAATTISDGDTGRATAASPKTENAASPTAHQVAQLELMPPLPVGGYQPVAGRPYSPDDTLEMSIDRSLARLQSEANPQLVAGLALRAHSGDEGLNKLTEFGMPIEASFSPWLTGTARLTVLPVYMTAGTVGVNQLVQFGANPILAATGATLAPSGQQDASGVGILGGYSFLDWSAQIGTTPLGFPVTHLVGSVAYAPKFLNNTLSFRIEGIRQPVTDSVLSYAGAKASLSAANAATGGAFGTNATWGGVVKTGGQAMVFYDDTMFGAYGGGGWAALTGENVPYNQVFNGMVGTYFRPYKTDTDQLRAGIALFYMGYAKNLSGFTFGQGGYFSPHNYEALTFPVEYTGRSGNWSYLASAAVGVQHFNQRSSPIFPNNPFAQSALVATGANGNFSGSSSTGPAFNIKGQLEYAIDNSLSVGVAASLDNGNNYTEGIGKVYLRKTFDWLAPITTPGDQSVVTRDLPQSRL